MNVFLKIVWTLLPFVAVVVRYNREYNTFTILES
jgi:hypothetical protein